ncbi:ATP-binding cassette domain-containing protein [Escherichia coli]
MRLLPRLCTGQRGVRPAIGRIEKMQRLEIAHQMLKKVGLEGAEKRYIWQLSGGHVKRVGIARALAANPRAVITRRTVCARTPSPRTRCKLCC